MLQIPFTRAEFLLNFEQYNLAVYPMQAVLHLLAVIVLLFIFYDHPKKDKFINFILAFLWFWAGLVYHILFFAEINLIALVFGGIFIVQGILFLLSGVLQRSYADYNFRWNYSSILGLLFVFVALFIYPILSIAAGHIYPQAPSFGLPCPLVMFTFGVLLLASKPVAWYIYVIPFLWSLIGISTALNLGVIEDFTMVFIGVIGTGVLSFYRPESQIAIS